jgi:prephenate dehydratase
MTPGPIAYLGPAGTFTESAALLHSPESALISCQTVAAVAASIVNCNAHEGVVPIENSLVGSVPDTLDLLIQEPTLFIRQEIVVPINHCLLVSPGTSEADINIIYSHPQALGQCRQFLEKHFPHITMSATLSTAAAVEQLQHTQHAAAIGTVRASHLYGAEVLAQGIQDSPANVTRFIVLGRADHPPTGRDKTSLCFSFKGDHSGLLHSVLGEFAKREINLGKVESRPTKESLGKYIFLIDLDGHRLDSLVKEAIDSMRGWCSMLKIFGSYPKWTTNKE